MKRGTTLLAGAMLGAAVPLAIAAPQGETRARYERERAACVSGQSHQALTSCLREAAAAYSEARQGQLANVRIDYDANALVRCRALPSDDRKDCEARMRGAGKTFGSFEQGAILREKRTRQVQGPDGRWVDID